MTPSDDSFLTHNRLTHSLKVAQVARSIAENLLHRPAPEIREAIEKLGGLDADVTEAAALAHDIGHPPFGHVGEVVLDRYARRELDLADGFEGNAQTLRIMATTDPRTLARVGMDVSAATMAAVLKYPWDRNAATPVRADQVPKFGYYRDEADVFTFARAWLPDGYDGEAQTLEAAIMDIADDITYALHDLEDFRVAGLISLSEVRDELDTWFKMYSVRVRQGDASVGDDGNHWGVLRRRLIGHPMYDPDLFVEAVEAASNHLRGLSEPSVTAWRVAQENSRRFISHQITASLAEIQLNPAPTRNSPPVQLNRQHWHLIQILKQVTRDFVIARADVAAVQRGQQKRLWELLEMLHQWIKDDGDAPRASAELRDLWDAHGARGLLDYVVTLTDRRAAALYDALTGAGDQTVVTGLAL